MSYGWTGKTLDVDLTAGRTIVRDTLAHSRSYLGGRALALRLAWEQIPGRIDAFDPQNRIFLTTGPLTGTLSPTAGRTVMGSVSPRAYPRPWYTHSTMGGWFGAELKYAGFDAVVLHGRAAKPVYLDLTGSQPRLLEAGDLWGQDARQTQLALKQRLGERTQILAIGPAGENLVRFATVQHSEENAAGHSGFGAVWGSKQLKAIAVHGDGGVAVARPADLLREVFGVGSFTVAPGFGSMRPAFQDKSPRPVCSQACTFNCMVNSYTRTEDGRRKPQACIGPVWTASAMKNTEYSGDGMHVPAGRNFGKRDVHLHELCNSLGLDMWFRLVMQPWLIRCRQLGITELRGHHIEPEDGAWFEGFMYDLAYRRGVGEVLADGLRRAMDALEDELPNELIALGRELEFAFGFPAHREGRFWDEEPLPFWVISAMMYASESRDPTIGSHLSSMHLADCMLVLKDEALSRRQYRRLARTVWGYAEALDPTFENKAPVAMWSQHQHMLIDSLPMCDFAFPQLLRPMSAEEWRTTEDILGDLDLDRRLLAAVTGVAYSRDELTRIAARALNLERLLLARAGRQRTLEESLASHFKLPCRADGTSIDAAGFARLLDEYYSARGWDNEHGWPTAQTLQALGLADAVPDLIHILTEANP